MFPICVPGWQMAPPPIPMERCNRQALTTAAAYSAAHHNALTTATMVDREAHHAAVAIVVLAEAQRKV